MLLAPLLLALAPAGDVYTVDDDGPADFATLDAAIAAVHMDDILLVQPGDYAGFVQSKALTILGPATGGRPHIHGPVLVDASSVNLAGLQFDALQFSGIFGSAVLDDCLVGAGGAGTGGLAIDACDGVYISRCTIVGAGQLTDDGGPGLQIASSSVALVASHITGGAGHDALPFGPGGDGGPGLAITDDSYVLVAACTIEGGRAGMGSGAAGPDFGAAGDGLQLAGSTAVVRGGTGHSIHAGSTGGQGTPGADLVVGSAQALATLVIGGVEYDPAAVVVGPGSSLLVPLQPEPWLEIPGDDAPGGTRTITLTGPAGAPALLLASLYDNYLQLPSLEGPLWLRVQMLLFSLWVAMAGPAQPFELSLQLPASLAGIEGTTLIVQAVFSSLGSTIEPGKKVVTNPDVLVVRF